MSDKDMKYPERANPDQVKTLMSWLRDFFGQFRLAWELLWDGRVPFVTKIVPILTLLYILSPVDIIPDVALGLGQLDDLAIFLIGLRLFIDVCPPALVAEHQTEEASIVEISDATPSMDQTAPTGQIIDVEAKVVPNADALPDSEVKSKQPIPHVW